MAHILDRRLNHKRLHGLQCSGHPRIKMALCGTLRELTSTVKKKLIADRAICLMVQLPAGICH